MARRPREDDGTQDLHNEPPSTKARGDGYQPQEQDEQIAYDGIPQGWRSCPCFGQPLLFMNSCKLIPMKVPLDQRYDDRIEPKDRFYPEQALDYLQSQDWKPGLVVDLTNTRRYYDPAAFKSYQVEYVKIACRGRGEAPSTENVNQFMWQVLSFCHEFPEWDIVVHCTHGFNRTGYMICAALIRVMEMKVIRALQAFAKARPPGIYKEDYIQQMFKYYHEVRPRELRAPGTPEWKGPSRSPERPHEAPESPVEEDMKHDDVIGESIDAGEAFAVQLLLMEKMLGPDWDKRGRRPFFPGSQPVSLAKSNLDLLSRRRYWVTWKADGTRYMLLLCKWGCYLIDRKFDVRRLQMRFPTRVSSAEREKRRVLVGVLHHNTLMDGEMVVDEDKETGVKSRRFLVYDLMVLRDEVVAGRMFKDRYEMIEREVMEPRNMERNFIQDGKYTYPYDYSTEPFRVRRKEFWPLFQSRKLIDNFIPGLSHESDGLILQGYEDAYKPMTCEELMKWKFPHLNSVDFKLIRAPEGALQLCVMQPIGKNRPPAIVPLAEEGFRFPDDLDPNDFVDKIVECSYDAEKVQWVYLRERTDKNLPNAKRVYEKVVQSIVDNITQEVLLGEVDKALESPAYSKDVAAAAAGQQDRAHAGQHPAQPAFHAAHTGQQQLVTHP